MISSTSPAATAWTPFGHCAKPAASLWELLASGTDINARHTIQVGGEIHAKVKATHRQMVALYAMRYSGKLNGRTKLKLSWGTDPAPLAGLTDLTIT